MGAAILRRTGRAAFCIYLVTNMAVCVVVFLPWAQPRETVSGLLGRWRDTETGWKRRFAIPACWIVDRIYFWEPDHCRYVYQLEQEARGVLYP